MIPDRWLQIDSIFQAALERGPDERAAFLVVACAGDQDLRSEVERLITYDGQQQCLLDTSVIEAAAGLLGAGQPELAPGEQVGHYAIISSLGRGGMGEVYLAEDSRLGRRVALKLLPGDFTGSEHWLRRFRQEARAASALNHPNIIIIYEIGEADGRHFIATEFVDGETLRQRMGNRRMELTEALDVAVKIAEALAAAHQAGIIHRDIKPENIMLRPDGAVKVLDFGLAKMGRTTTPIIVPAIEAAAFDTNPGILDTHPGMVMGTAAYASPEQARGQEVDAASDVYSLGTVVFESLAGRTPFEGETASDIIVSKLEQDPPRLSDCRQDLPNEIDRIVNKAITRDKEQRYPTAKDLLVDLSRAREALEANPELSRSPLALEPSRRPRRATRRSVVAVLALVAALGAAAMMATRTLRAKHGDSPPITSMAVLPFVNEHSDSNLEYLADGMTEGLIRSLSQISSLTVISRTSAFRFKGREADPKTVGQELKVQAVLTGRVRQSGDKLSIYAELARVEDGSQLWSDEYSGRIADALLVQGEISAAIVKRLQLQPSVDDARRLSDKGTTSAEAYQLYMKGRFFWARNTIEGRTKAADFFQQAVAIDPNYSLAHTALAVSYAFILHNVPPSEMTETSAKGESAALRALALDDALAEAHTALAWIKLSKWDWPAAEHEFKRALELDPNDAQSHHWYSLYLSCMRRFDESLVEIRKAQELDPISLRINTALGDSLSWAGHDDEAIIQIRNVLEMDPNYMAAHYRLGMVYVQKAMFTEAIAETQKAVSLTPGDPEMFAQLGAIYAMCGQRNKALKILEKVKDLNRRDGSLGVAIATLYAVLDDKEQSLRWLNAAYESHDPPMFEINRDSYWDKLRSDPRFKDLLRRMGFEGSSS